MKHDIENVMEKYGDMIYRIALTHTGSPENAEDVFQEVFIAYSEKLLGFKDESHKKAWLIRVAINKCKNIKASSWNRKTVELDENISFENPEELGVFEAVNSLPENYRTVIYLTYYEGYKVKEIAEILKINENTVKIWAFRAREMLKQSLEGGF